MPRLQMSASYKWYLLPQICSAPGSPECSLCRHGQQKAFERRKSARTLTMLAREDVLKSEVVLRDAPLVKVLNRQNLSGSQLGIQIRDIGRASPANTLSSSPTSGAPKLLILCRSHISVTVSVRSSEPNKNENAPPDIRATKASLDTDDPLAVSE